MGIPKELTKIVNYLKNELNIKDLSKTKFFLCLQIEHLPNGILVHQSTYTKKVLKNSHLDKTHPSRTPMVVRSLNGKKDPFHSKKDDEETLSLEVPYLSAINALMYHENCTQIYKSNPQLVRNKDACYLSDPQKSRSQTTYMFTCGKIIISWRSLKRTKIITIHEVKTFHLKFFYTHELQKSGDIDVKHI